MGNLKPGARDNGMWAHLLNFILIGHCGVKMASHGLLSFLSSEIINHEIFSILERMKTEQGDDLK